MNRFFSLFALLALLALAATAGPAAAGVLPDMAAELADELNSQLAAKHGGGKGVTLIITTPVNLSTLESASPLARLMAEEMSTWFVSLGYRVQEIRRSSNILFSPQKGEMILTRRAQMLDQRTPQAALILTGTYTATSQRVRFNMRLMHAATNEIVAMASGTLPVNREVYELMGDGAMSMGIRPSVATKINANQFGY
jgi:hypothetical protein